MSRSVRVLGALVVLLVLAPAAFPARAGEAFEVAWWWQGRPTGPVPTPPVGAPPVQPGGLYVAGDPGGAFAESAIRIPVPDHSATVRLVIVVDQAQGTPVIDACPAIDHWDPVADGPWDEAPRGDCAGLHAPGRMDADGKTMRFDLSGMDDRGEVDVVLLPGLDATTGQTAAFSAWFVPVGSSGVSVVSNDEPIASEDSPVADDVAAPADDAAAPGPLDLLPTFTTVAPAAVSAAPPTVARRAPVRRLRPIRSVLPAPEGFAYPAVLALPLVLVIGFSYIGWTLRRPVPRGRA